jgi:DNA repair protein RadD
MKTPPVMGAFSATDGDSNNTDAVHIADAAPRAQHLRPYQDQIIETFDRAVASGKRRILLVAPTGSGKTIIASEIIRRARDHDQWTLVLAHRREIIAQTYDKLAANGVRAGIIQAGIQPRPLERVQVASISTLHHRAMLRNTMELPLAHVLGVDECHHAPAETYRGIIKAYPDAILFGLTATPCRGDGRGLGGIFEVMIECPQVAELIELGYLVRSNVFAPVDPDLRGIGIRNGDYIETNLASRMDQPKLIGDIVMHWHKFGERRKTVVFAINVAHSIHLRDEFRRSGVRAEHIDGETAKDQRDAILAALAAGEIAVVTNCMVLTEGWDCPDVGCCVLARPTKKMGLYRQMVGRVLRPAPGKINAIILDHSGAVFEHGLPEDRVQWTLDPDERAYAPAHKVRKERSAGKLIECSQCSAMHVAGARCPCCGFKAERRPEYQPIADGELGLVQGGKASGHIFDPVERERWHGMLVTIGRERGYKPGWATANYKNKFGVWPAYGHQPAPLAPSAEVLSWVRSRQIAYSKARFG